MPTENPPGGTMSGAAPIEKCRRTFGKICSNGAVLELLNGRRLPLWDGRVHRISQELRVGNTLYRPKRLVYWKPTLPGSVGDPSQATALISELQNQVNICGLGEREARLVSFLIVSTWFSDCIPWVPSLILHGPMNETSQLLQVLAAVCRRGIFVPQPTVAALKQVPGKLWPTVVFAQRELNRNLQQLLVATNQRYFPRQLLPRVGEFAKVIYCDQTDLDPWLRVTSLTVHVPRFGLARIDTDKLAEHFQSLLLAYRLQQVHAVSQSEFDAPQFCSAVRTIARALGSCVPGTADLQSEIVAILQENDEELRADNVADIDCLLIETLLSYCHEKNENTVFVHQIAERLSALGHGRGEAIHLHPRAVGQKLKALGVLTQRLAGGAGRGIVLDDALQKRIHRLASLHEVPVIKDKVVACPQCNLSKQSN